MSLKSVKRTATVAWAPLSPNLTLLATGTVAGALDASFSATTELEIFNLDLANRNLPNGERVCVTASSAR